MNVETWITISVFILTMSIIFWRPRGINEAWPASVGAIMILLTGIVSQGDIADIANKIGGASITIISTIVMAITLESFGFFHWTAARLVNLVKGSGYRLYWYIQALCFLMTLLFNNDGSILITTPILIILLKNLRIKPSQQIPYLLSGALIATASSTPIGVSNIVNLIALKIVNMTLFHQTAMMFVPAMIGLFIMSFLMFMLVKKKIPRKLPIHLTEIEESFVTTGFHPLKGTTTTKEVRKRRTKFMLRIMLFVLIIRCLLFVASYFSIPIEIVAVLGSLLLLVYRWYRLGTNPLDLLKKTPWHILVFAFSMYVIIYGLHNVGLTEMLVELSKPIVDKGLMQASIIMGGMVSILSNIFNNHPALMVGTMALTEMGLDPLTIQTLYLANIIGSDIGALLLPIGTLASLIWLHILRQNKIKIKWKDYLKITIIVIPITTILTLFILYFWVQFIFA